MKIRSYWLLLMSVLVLGGASMETEGSSWVMRGWMKMLSERGGDFASLPSKFLVNTQFSHQMAINKEEDLISSDEYGYLNIPDEVHFYFMMNAKNLYMVNGRRNDLATTQISVAFLDLVERKFDEAGQEVGGIQDIGNFKEGFCFRLLSKESMEYTLCTDTITAKNSWMDKIRPLIQQADGQEGMKGSVAGSAA